MRAVVSAASSPGPPTSRDAMGLGAESRAAIGAACAARPSTVPGRESRRTASPTTSCSGVRTCRATMGRGVYGTRKTEVLTFRISGAVASLMDLENGEVVGDRGAAKAMAAGTDGAIYGTDAEVRGVRREVPEAGGVMPAEGPIAAAGLETITAMVKLTRPVGGRMRCGRAAISGAS